MYTRVSSERNSYDQGVVSLQAQREALQKLAEDEGYEIVGEYCEGDESEKASTVTRSTPSGSSPVQPRGRLEAQVLHVESRRTGPATRGAGG